MYPLDKNMKYWRLNTSTKNNKYMLKNNVGFIGMGKIIQNIER